MAMWLAEPNPTLRSYCKVLSHVRIGRLEPRGGDPGGTHLEQKEAQKESADFKGP